MKKIICVSLLGLISFSELTPPLYAASRSTLNTFGRTQISQDLQIVPDSATDLTTTDTWIFQLTVTNTTASAVTFTVKDRATSAKTLMSVSIAANTMYVVVWPEGQKMKGGINWLSGTTGALTASLVAFKVP
jgi:hypothetical protein